MSELRKQDGGAVDLRRVGQRQRGINVGDVERGSVEEDQIREIIQKRGR